MMPVGTVRLTLPDGREIENPTAAQLGDLILSKDQKYWEYQSGDVGLRFEGPQDDAEMILILKEPHGIFIQHIGVNDWDEYCAVGPDTDGGIVVAYVGGEPRRLPRRHLLPRAVALRVVEEFCRSGARSNDVAWAPSPGV